MIWSVLSSLNALGFHPVTGLFAAVDAPIAMNEKNAEATTAVMIVLIFKAVVSFVSPYLMRQTRSVAEVPAFAVVVAREDVLRDQDFVDLVGTVGESQRAGALVHAGQRQIA